MSTFPLFRIVYRTWKTSPLSPVEKYMEDGKMFQLTQIRHLPPVPHALPSLSCGSQDITLQQTSRSGSLVHPGAIYSLTANNLPMSRSSSIASGRRFPKSRCWFLDMRQLQVCICVTLRIIRLNVDSQLNSWSVLYCSGS
jgi:hypothetical protein